jgi:diguanylate cyclase (GGDEF)-like protein
MSRASILLVALLVLNSLLGALCLVVARGEQRSRALRLWGWGLLLYSVGLVVSIASFLPLDPRKVLGNSLIAFAPILCLEGAITDTGVRLSRRFTMAGFALSVVPILANHLSGRPLVLIDYLAPAPIAIVLFVIGAVVLVRRPPPWALGAARLLAATCLLSVVIWTFRMAAIWTSVGASNDRERADLIVAAFSIAQIVSSVAATFALLWIEVRKMEAALLRQADTDALTGLANRRATLRSFQEKALLAERQGRLLALAVLDLDHFKQVNDAHGHLAGDRVLQQVATVLRDTCRSADIVGRIGGEEFVLLLSDPAEPPERQEGAARTAAPRAQAVSSDAAALAAQRLCAAVAATAVPLADRSINVTLSGGVALYPTDGRSWDQLFMVADRRLYEAKRAGRNRVVGPVGDITLSVA